MEFRDLQFRGPWLESMSRVSVPLPPVAPPAYLAAEYASRAPATGHILTNQDYDTLIHSARYSLSLLVSLKSQALSASPVDSQRLQILEEENARLRNLLLLAEERATASLRESNPPATVDPGQDQPASTPSIADLTQELQAAHSRVQELALEVESRQRERDQLQASLRELERTRTEESRRLQEETRRANEEARKIQEEARRSQEEARRAQEETRRAQEEARRQTEEGRRVLDESKLLTGALQQREESLRGLRGTVQSMKTERAAFSKTLAEQSSQIRSLLDDAARHRTTVAEKNSLLSEMARREALREGLETRLVTLEGQLSESRAANKVLERELELERRRAGDLERLAQQERAGTMALQARIATICEAMGLDMRTLEESKNFPRQSDGQLPRTQDPSESMSSERPSSSSSRSSSASSSSQPPSIVGGERRTRLSGPDIRFPPRTLESIRDLQRGRDASVRKVIEVFQASDQTLHAFLQSCLSMARNENPEQSDSAIMFLYLLATLFATAFHNTNHVMLPGVSLRVASTVKQVREMAEEVCSPVIGRLHRSEVTCIHLLQELRAMNAHASDPEAVRRRIKTLVDQYAIEGGKRQSEVDLQLNALRSALDTHMEAVDSLATECSMSAMMMQLSMSIGTSLERMVLPGSSAKLWSSFQQLSEIWAGTEETLQELRSNEIVPASPSRPATKLRTAKEVSERACQCPLHRRRRQKATPQSLPSAEMCIAATVPEPLHTLQRFAPPQNEEATLVDLPKSDAFCICALSTFAQIWVETLAKHTPDI